VFLDLSPRHNQLPESKLIFRAVVHLISVGGRRTLRFQDIKMQGLLFSPVERFDYKNSPKIIFLHGTGEQARNGRVSTGVTVELPSLFQPYI
jgi:hypothetical protein